MIRVLLAVKATQFERFGSTGRDPRLRALLESEDPRAAHVRQNHDETVRSRTRVRAILRSAGFDVRIARRTRTIPDGSTDLVIIVGGDGTVLDFARLIGSTPVLAVNSSPSTSVGHFCCATADTLEPVLDRILSGRAHPLSLTRIRVTVDGEPAPWPALNDVLFAHANPAATSRYLIQIGDVAEVQKSSGIWISTASGSTGAIRSAGGECMDLSDRRLQYRVREPFLLADPGRGYRLMRGTTGPEPILLTSRMLHGCIFLDGRRGTIRLGFGSIVTVGPDASPLRIFLPRW